MSHLLLNLSISISLRNEVKKTIHLNNLTLEAKKIKLSSPSRVDGNPLSAQNPPTQYQISPREQLFSNVVFISPNPPTRRWTRVLQRERPEDEDDLRCPRHHYRRKANVKKKNLFSDSHIIICASGRPPPRRRRPRPNSGA